ncbi:MAG: tannase/feruloyl esterase family alpha/beta hydrolase, partial [Syntrophorhabdus sp.]
MKDRNKRNRRIVLTIVFLIGLCLIFGNEAAAVKPKLSCNDLSDFTYPNTVITSATLVLDGQVSVAGIGPMPEHCVVTGRMNERVGTLDGKTYAIGFEMRLPTQWKKRFLYQANGGIDGSVVP